MNGYEASPERQAAMWRLMCERAEQIMAEKEACASQLSNIRTPSTVAVAAHEENR